MLRVVVACLCAAALLLGPAVAAAQEAAPAAEPTIELTAPAPPIWRVTPPSTDPSPATPRVLGIQVLRGLAVHGEGDLVLLDLDGVPAVVHLPDVGFDAALIPDGSTVEAEGTAMPDGILDAWHVSVYP